MEPAEWQVNDLGQMRGLYTADQILWAATLAFNQPPPEGLEMEQVSLWVDGADAALTALLRELGMEKRPQ